MPAAHRVFGELARLLSDQSFFAGRQATLADMIVAPHLDMMEATPEWAELGAPRRNLCAWLERMRARPSFLATTREKLLARVMAAA